MEEWGSFSLFSRGSVNYPTGSHFKLFNSPVVEAKNDKLHTQIVSSGITYPLRRGSREEVKELFCRLLQLNIFTIH